MNKSLKKMRNAIIMMQCAYEQYKEAAQQLEAEQQAAQVDAVKPVVKVKVEAEIVPVSPEVIELPKAVYGNDFDEDFKQQRIAVANQLCILAGLEEVKGESIIVGLKQFYNKKSTKPFLDRYHVNVSIMDHYGEKELASRYIHINSLGKDIDLFLRKLGGLTWVKDTYEPVNIWLPLK